MDNIPFRMNLGGISRTIRNIFPGAASSEEKFHFIRHENIDSPENTEMTTMSNGDLFKTGNGEMGNGNVSYITDDVIDEDEQVNNKKNQISEWQAGWNVTNAIQVKFKIVTQSSLKNYKTYYCITV